MCVFKENIVFFLYQRGFCGDIFAVFGVEKLKVGANKREKVEINWSLMNESQSFGG